MSVYIGHPLYEVEEEKHYPKPRITANNHPI
jgi:hypothetical protein